MKKSIDNDLEIDREISEIKSIYENIKRPVNNVTDLILLDDIEDLKKYRKEGKIKPDWGATRKGFAVSVGPLIKKEDYPGQSHLYLKKIELCVECMKKLEKLAKSSGLEVYQTDEVDFDGVYEFRYKFKKIEK